MTSVKTTVLYSQAMYSSSLYISEEECILEIFLKFDDFRRKGMDFWKKLVDNEGGIWS